jgi:small-conductance mechanosensitive channel
VILGLVSGLVATWQRYDSCGRTGVMRPRATAIRPHRPRMRVTSVLVASAVAAAVASLVAQTTPPAAADRTTETAIAAAAAEQAEPSPPATLSYANRPIVELRSSILGRSAGDRVATGRTTIDGLVSVGIFGPVQARSVGPVSSLEMAGRRIVAILPADVNPLTDETPADAGTAAALRLQTALDEAAELHRPRQLLIGTLQALLATVLAVALGWLLIRARNAITPRLDREAERRLHATAVGDREFVRSTRIIQYLERLVLLVTWAFGLLLAYFWLSFVLRRFPYTRPWGESLREFLLGQLSRFGVAMLQALPGLFTVLVILLLTRVVTRIVQLLFDAIEAERISLPWMYQETAQPTRKLLTAGLWLFAIAMAYPYLPGSNSEAFKGMSVFVGLVISLGSSGIINQVMSGFTLTYSRALRTGDFVAVGDVQGVVSQVGTLSTKIKTIKGEDVTIPNAVVVSQIVTNYSRYNDAGGVFVPTEVTIGYDVPWRQVEALLLLAAARSAGVRRDPAPLVREAALEDAYIRYTLLFCLENPAARGATLTIVHANILDAFNEYGVQITSPNYEADPGAPKVVPREQWFAAPAAPTAPATDTLKVRT